MSRKRTIMDVEEYSKYLQFYTDEIPELLVKYLNKANWKSYLDLGCGDGALLYALNKKGYFYGKIVYAIDLSESRISLAKRIDKDFRCFVDDACNIQTIKDNSIDFLVSTHVIEHVTHDEAMVKEILATEKTQREEISPECFLSCLFYSLRTADPRRCQSLRRAP